MRAAVYTRISLDKSGEGAGVERQRDECLELIAARSWTLAEVYSDNSISAAGRRRRPEFESLLAAVGRGEVDVVVAWAWDRLSRNRRDEVALIEACKARGASVVLVRGAGDLDLSSAVGRGIAEILATIGRLEIEQKAERHRSHLAQRAREGLPWGPTPAFGYGPDRVTIVEAEAELIRGAYTAVLAGTSCRSIAAGWNTAGWSSRTGRPWSGAAIKRLLINPRYMGVRGTSVGTGTRRILREVGPAVWDPIVGEDVWRAAHALLTSPERASTTVRARVHLLPGIARCGRCGAVLRSHVTDRGVTAYVCSAVRHLSRKAEPLDVLVVEHVLARLARADARELLADEERPDVGPLREQATALRARISATRAEFVRSDVMSPAELRDVLGGLGARLEEVEAALSTSSRAPVLRELVDAVDVEAVWDGLDLQRRRAVIATLLVPWVHPARKGPGFDPSTVAIEWL